MSGWFQNLLKGAAGGFFGSDYLRDYTHADKAYHTNLYQYAPKLKFLFHCYFNINSDVYDIDGNPNTQQNFGLLVRDVKLPAYTIQTAQMNQYNRKRIVQTKIKYDPVTFSFFDDNSNTMAKMWAAYYTYYYNDGNMPDVVFGGVRGGKGQDLSSTIKKGTIRGLGSQVQGGGANDSKYFDRNIYQPSITDNVAWGYEGSNNSKQSGDKKPSFFKDITIYGFYQKNFIAYTLINPIITQFAHDTYNYEESAGIMKNTMTLDYETVVYNEGAMAGDKPSGGGLVPGFAVDGLYDRKLSPIAMPGSNNTVLGQGGLVDGLSGTLKSLGSNPPNVIGAIKSAGSTYNTFKNTNIVQTLKNDLQNQFINSMRQEPNATRNLNFDFKNPASGPGSAGNASAPPIDSTGGTSSLQNTDKTKGTAYRESVAGPIDFGATALDYIGIPNVPPAGKQSNTGGGVNLPPTQQDVNTVFQNNLFG
jgi:hypothetical protein